MGALPAAGEARAQLTPDEVRHALSANLPQWKPAATGVLARLPESQQCDAGMSIADLPPSGTTGRRSECDLLDRLRVGSVPR